MSWTILVADPVKDWLVLLSEADFDAIAASVDLLEEHGPSLGRPAVDTVRGSKHSNMKELRSFGGHLRVLFAFDPQRQAILLVGGDKRNKWKSWYKQAIPLADTRYDLHLETINHS